MTDQFFRKDFAVGLGFRPVPALWSLASAGEGCKKGATHMALSAASTITAR